MNGMDFLRDLPKEIDPYCGLMWSYNKVLMDSHELYGFPKGFPHEFDQYCGFWEVVKSACGFRWMVWDFLRYFQINLTHIAGFVRLLKVLVDFDEWYGFP